MLYALTGLLAYARHHPTENPLSPQGRSGKYTKLAQVTASPLRGEAERSSDEGDILS